MPRIIIFSERCKGFKECGICSFVCPKDFFRSSELINRLGYMPSEIRNEQECSGCQNCMIYCPDFAIVVEKDINESSVATEDANERSK